MFATASRDLDSKDGGAKPTVLSRCRSGEKRNFSLCKTLNVLYSECERCTDPVRVGSTPDPQQLVRELMPLAVINALFVFVIFAPTQNEILRLHEKLTSLWKRDIVTSL